MFLGGGAAALEDALLNIHWASSLGNTDGFNTIDINTSYLIKSINYFDENGRLLKSGDYTFLLLASSCYGSDGKDTFPVTLNLRRYDQKIDLASRDLRIINLGALNYTTVFFGTHQLEKGDRIDQYYTAPKEYHKVIKGTGKGFWLMIKR